MQGSFGCLQKAASRVYLTLSPQCRLLSVPSLSLSHSSFPRGIRSFSSTTGGEIQTERMDFDLLIVGAGPAGLASAIRAKQVANEQGKELNVCVVEKGGEVGAHILSGNVFEPRALKELFSEEELAEAPLTTPVKEDRFLIMTSDKSALPIPQFLLPPSLHNHGNFIISLGSLCKWMAEKAEELGVEVYPGFAASAAVKNEKGAVVGVQTADVGIAKDGSRKSTFEPGMELYAKQTVIAEGCRGSLAESLMADFNLREGVCPQQYGIGLKEVWEVPKENHKPGLVLHSVGWPLDMWTYGGAFVYHMEPNLVLIGMVVGLDYKDPYLHPYNEFQRFKTHPKIREMLEGGECVSYGARALNEGGVQAVPRLSFPGGVLTGCSAGFLNVPKIKGSHLALKTGMLAGEAAALRLLREGGEVEEGEEMTEYENAVKESWVWEELQKVRNAKPAFKKGGLWGGLAYSGFSLMVARGKEPWTFRWTQKDSEATGEKEKYKPREYPKPDGVLTFDLLENLQRSGTNHEADQPVHLHVREDRQDLPLGLSLPKYDGPETRFCPAKVYEFVEDDDGKPKLQINAQNCLHCKTCSIKTPGEYIQWRVPEGGGGPAYSGM
uniref:Electron transfer flavoprotein-ubiquinone oxidoreductase n=1 Tax=Chromera velia CCMP2878 TaxID=1169474 RepID=A0A0G4HX56_9ALVE|eukprot:Cvel_9173.t1-p1 / transcript=Cvel_9173.t1 / gene=Cvel_9173 / organism=Chromera_velia_CCMP2878 / gene_product=Electron transfer flavoprotein-ubiquinone, putative / transcript_product=Electron transfer flavoprotein-ubiquinone, putative / location=Cvel_scaffold522:61717-64050(+) / protein_length=607 / sequence_SO=supercontig / SO=protein_coding / is_pseudo=false